MKRTKNTMLKRYSILINYARICMIAFAVLIGLILLMVNLPTFKLEVSGTENFASADCPLGLTAQLYPSESFLHDFPYETGDYWYYNNGVLTDHYAVAFSVLEYTPEQYQRAKDYCFQQFTHVDEHQYQIGHYRFIEHLWNTSRNEAGEWALSCNYPESFNMFAYNDENSTLLFMGYYESNDDPDTQLALTDFEDFYKQHFSKYYKLK